MMCLRSTIQTQISTLFVTGCVKNDDRSEFKENYKLEKKFQSVNNFSVVAVCINV